MRIGRDSAEILMLDLDKHESVIRDIIYEGLEELPPISNSLGIIATYFINVGEGEDLESVGREISLHQTTSAQNSTKDGLLERCTGNIFDILPFDRDKRVGLIRINFPSEIMVDSKSKIYSSDIMHIIAGSVQYELRASKDIKLVDVRLPEEIINLFPGPCYGVEGIRKMAGLKENELMFGTIVKPCTGITSLETAEIIGKAASNKFFSFVKEDENFHPNVPFARLEERVRLSVEYIKNSLEQREGKGLIYAPHVTSSRREFERNLKIAVDSGASAVMFSETYTGGAFRLARDLLSGLDKPLAIYGHNGGIGSRSKSIYREVIDMFARLDGIDFRQTGLTGSTGYLRPYGLELEKSEKILSRPMGKHKPVMMARAGGLDQGNIIINLKSILDKSLNPENYLFLSGSAINGWKNEMGECDPLGGAKAMEQALCAFYDKDFNKSEENHIALLVDYAKERGFKELELSLRQRYSTL